MIAIFRYLLYLKNNYLIALQGPVVFSILYYQVLFDQLILQNPVNIKFDLFPIIVQILTKKKNK